MAAATQTDFAGVAAQPVTPWYNVKSASGLTPLQMGGNFGLVGASCVVAQGTVHWTRTVMIQQQLASMAGKQPLGMLDQTSLIWKTEGMRGLYRGFSAAALREATYSSLRFGLYEPLKLMLASNEEEQLSPPVWQKVTAGLVAGAGAAAICSPTDLIMIQMAASKQFPPPTMAEVAKKVIASEGIAGLYKGIGTTVVRAGVLGATKMATYDVVKTEMRNRGIKEGPGLVFSASVVTGLAITITTSPATNLQTMIMSNKQGGGGGMLPAAMEIMRTQGPVGFFRGFGMQWARFGPYAVVQFTAWEALRNACGMKAI